MPRGRKRRFLRNSLCLMQPRRLSGPWLSHRLLKTDRKPMASSIALLLEFEQQRLLLAGDAHPHNLQAAIGHLRGSSKFALSACKLSHHGSKGNVSRRFLEALDCKKYIFSTNGFYFQHPDREAVARVIKFGGDNPTLAFNYRSAYTTIWAVRRSRKIPICNGIPQGRFQRAGIDVPLTQQPG
jgi:hypothetical protein